MPSDTDEDDDDEERLDCVHDIHGDGEEADVEEIDGEDDCDLSSEVQMNLMNNDQASSLEHDRLPVNESSMDGDIEDGDGTDTERRLHPKRPSLFKKISGIDQ